MEINTRKKNVAQVTPFIQKKIYMVWYHHIKTFINPVISISVSVPQVVTKKRLNVWQNLKTQIVTPLKKTVVNKEKTEILRKKKEEIT